MSADRKYDHTSSVHVYSEKGGQLRLKNPFGRRSFKVTGEYEMDGDIIVVDMSVGQKVRMEIAEMKN